MLPSELQLGIVFCHNVVQPLAKNQESIPRYTIWRKKTTAKKPQHTLCFGKDVWENSLPEPSCLWLLRRIWLIQRLLTASHYVFIFCQNQKITSILKIAAHSQMLFYSCPLKLLDTRSEFLLKSNYVSSLTSE